MNRSERTRPESCVVALVSRHLSLSKRKDCSVKSTGTYESECLCSVAASKRRDSWIIGGLLGLRQRRKRRNLTVRQTGFPIAEESLLAVAAKANLVVDTRRPVVTSRCPCSAVDYLIRGTIV